MITGKIVLVLASKRASRLLLGSPRGHEGWVVAQACSTAQGCSTISNFFHRENPFYFYGTYILVLHLAGEGMREGMLACMEAVFFWGELKSWLKSWLKST